MAATATRKRTTAADLAAAVALGSIDPDADVTLGADGPAEPVHIETSVASSAALPADHHECGIPGCRHGSHGPTQPDRQLKLIAPCGAVARMTVRALARAGVITCGHGDAFVIDDTRRQYRRNGGAS